MIQLSIGYGNCKVVALEIILIEKQENIFRCQKLRFSFNFNRTLIENIGQYETDNVLNEKCVKMNLQMRIVNAPGPLENGE